MKVPKKNIYPVLADIRTPEPFIDPATFSVSSPPPPPPKKQIISFSPSVLPPKIKVKKKIAWPSFIGGLLLAVVVFYALSLVNLNNQSRDSANFILGQFLDTADSLKDFNPENAKKSLLVADREIKQIQGTANNLGLTAISNLFGHFLPPLKKAAASVNSLYSVTSAGVDLTDNLTNLKDNGANYFFLGEGDKLISNLKGLKNNLNIINRESSHLYTTASPAALTDNHNYLAIKTNLLGLEDFLSALISFLEYPKDRHWLISFQNNSEIRATGGFIGSFTDLTINNGSLKNLTVTDIYDPDGQLEEKVVPPLALQTVTVNWGARDSNWFFDFPTSAKKTIEFLNNSKIYSERGITFDGLIAINTNVLASLLKIIGPVDLPDYDLVLTSDNFLAAIQTEVEVKRTTNKNQPKTILKDLTPIIIKKITTVPPTERELILQSLTDHLANKDIMFYSDDASLQKFFIKNQVAGAVFPLSPNSVSDYLAVVNTNVAGGKSDAYLNQTIDMNSEINLDGSIFDTVSITRAHSGNTAKESWYRAKNQDYIRLLTPLNSELISIENDTKKGIRPSLDYEKSGYRVDNDLARLENDKIEAGKTVFDAWLTTLAGETKTITFYYKHPDKLFLRPGQTYQFVYEKQSGVQGGINIKIEAPPGFKWAENNSFTYAYSADNSPKRLILKLTLVEV